MRIINEQISNEIKEKKETVENQRMKTAKNSSVKGKISETFSP
jgi:hypothetical protein